MTYPTIVPQYTRQAGKSSGVSVGSSTAVLLCGADDRRLTLEISATDTGNVAIGTDSNVTLGNGYVLSSSSGGLTLTRELHGDLVRMPFYVIADASSRKIGVLETFGG